MPATEAWDKEEAASALGEIVEDISRTDSIYIEYPGARELIAPSLTLLNFDISSFWVTGTPVGITKAKHDEAMMMISQQLDNASEMAGSELSITLYLDVRLALASVVTALNPQLGTDFEVPPIPAELEPYLEGLS